MRRRMVVTTTAPDQCHAAQWAPHRTHGAPVVVRMWIRGTQASQLVGQMVVSARTGYVAWVEIAEQFRGLGLARKLYGEAAKVVGVLLQEPHCSPSARRVWASIQASGAWRVVRHPGFWDDSPGVFARPAWPADLHPIRV